MRPPLCIFEELRPEERGPLWFTNVIGSVEIVGHEMIIADCEGDCIGLADVEGLVKLGGTA